MKNRLVGLAATLGILLMLVGIPAGLLVAAGSPIPGGVPGLESITSALTRPDDGTMLLSLLKVIGWLAWASFAAMVLLEIFSRVRGVRVPQIRALGMQQRAAAGLVGAAALLFTASPLIGAAPANAAPVTQHHQVHTSTVGSQQAATQQEVAATNAAQMSLDKVSAEQETTKQATTDYVVKHGDSLYSIAESLLGDGARFGEIAHLNYGVQQADGQALTSSHWIQPGWTLKVPAPAMAGSAGGHVTVEAGDTLSGIAQKTLGDADRYPELFDATKDAAQPGGAHLMNPDLIQPGWTITVPGQGRAPQPTAAPEPAPAVEKQTPHEVPAEVAPVAPEAAEQESAPVASAPAPSASEVEAGDQAQGARADQSGQPGQAGQADAVDQTDDVEEEAAFPVRTAAGVGSLLAAGLLTLIAARRARQQRRRRPGQSLPMPTGEAAEVEQELRALADPMSVETVDRALRTLSLRCAEEGKPLPKIRAARLTADQFDLYLAEPAQLPAPWDGTADSSVWTLAGEAEDLINAEDVENVPAPYPALVTVGHDEEDGHVFVDLEYLGAMGVIAEGGDEAQTRQVLGALAVELATSRWADDLQVTIVGGYAELEDSLETGRVRYVPTAGRLLEELTRRAEQDRQALIESGAGDLNHARVQNSTPGAWTPEIVLFTGQMTDGQRGLLQELVEKLPRVAIAAVTSGEAVGEWALRITGDQVGVLEPFGLSVRPQLLDDATYAQVLMVLAKTDEDDEVEHLEWEQHEEPTLADLEAVIAESTADVEEDEDDAVAAAADVELEPEQVEEPATSPAAELLEAEVTTEDQADTIAVSADEQDGSGNQPLETDLDEAAAGEMSPLTPAADLVVEEEEISNETPNEISEEPAAAVVDVDVDVDEEAAVALMPRRGPRVLLLGTVEVVDAAGPVEPTKKPRLTELAAIFATHPGSDHTVIDACYRPGERVTDNARNTQISKLRRWFGKTAEGDDFVPRYQSDAGYRLHEQVTSDWEQWKELLPDGPATASTAALEQALGLVRGEPFSGVRARYYSWAETLKQQMICAIVDAAYELARRRFMEGRWSAAEEATLIGLGIEPGKERLWRVRILAAHARGNAAAVDEAVERLLTISTEWGGELETETEELLDQLKNGTAPSRTLAGTAR